jgi:microcystin-dependent protein
MGAPTTNFSWTKPTVGGDTDIWGDELNTNLVSQDSLVRRMINNFILATAPAEAQSGTMWLDNTTNPYVLKIYDGTDWIIMGYMNTTTNTFTPPAAGNYIGDIKYSAQTTSHGSWLLCNGASVSTTTYSGLFALIGYTFGGSGANFTLPDLRGAVTGAIGTGSYTGATARTLGQFVGEESHVLTVAELAAHQHEAGFSSNDTPSNRFGIGTTTTPARLDYDSTRPLFTAGGALTSSVGSSTAHNTMQPTLFVGNGFIYSGV